MTRRMGLLLLLTLVGLAACTKQEPRLPLHSMGTFEIPGNEPFHQTGYDLVPGRYYMFHHRAGTVCVQGQKGCAPPRGSDVPGEECWGLRLQVGDEYVLLRDRLILSVEEPTPLVFYLPEGEEIEWSDAKRPYYEDNTGSWTIEVVTFNEAPEVEWLQGANVTSYSAGGYCGPGMGSLLRRLVTLGANAVLFVVVYETDGVDIYPANFSPRSYCLTKATWQARELGLKVGWNLHVDPPGMGSWRGTLQPPDKDAFFAEYRRFARYYAGLAQDNGVEILVPATEMVSLTQTKEDKDRWLSIFAELHGVFFGTIFYGADRSEFTELGTDFWHNCCDVAGLTPWYTLSEKASPDATELQEAWKPIAENLHKFAQAVQMQLVLVEAPGYRALESCAAEPADYVTRKKEGVLCQSEAYKAFLRTFTPDDKQLISGHFIWEIGVDGEPRTDYSPLDTITESILKQAWKGQRL
jgi:hypothetical protein